MTILVAGASGQVARALVERRGERPLAARGRPALDLTEPKSIDCALESRPRVVINAAAYTAVDAAETDETAAHALNAEGPGRLAARCVEAGIPLIHLSTDYVFDGTADRPYREDDPVDPRTAYGRTKLAGERAVAAAGGRALVVRTAWVYAPFGQNFVRTMLRLGARGVDPKVVDDQHGNPTSALDIADALLALADRLEAWPDGTTTLHMAGADATTWYGFARAVFAASPYRPDVTPCTSAEFVRPAPRPANSRLDTGRLAALFGIALPGFRASLPPITARLVAEDADLATTD